MNFEELSELSSVYAKHELMKQERMSTYSQEEKEAYEQGAKDLMDFSNELAEIQNKYKTVDIDQLSEDAFNRYINDQLKE